MKHTRRQTIAIDVDDVLAHSTESLRLVVNERTGAKLASEHYLVPGPYWGYYNEVWRRHGLDGQVNLDLLAPEMENDQSHVRVSDGAKAALEELARSYRLVVVTARRPAWERATKLWINEHFPDIFDEVVLGGGKYHDADVSKGDLCKQLGADYLIDDNVEHCLSAIEQGITPILFGNFGWHLNVPDDMHRCGSWQEVEDYFAGKTV